MFLNRNSILSAIYRTVLFAPEGADGGAPAAATDAAALDAAGIAPADEAAPADAPADEAGAGATDDAASPGDGEAGDDKGTTDEADAASGDAAAAEVVPFEGLVAPEGFASLDAEALTAATPILRELGVDTPERAQEVVNQFAPVLAGMVERAVAANHEAVRTAQVELAASWANEVKADPVIGGGNYAKTVADNAVVLDTFFSTEFREYLDVTGLGNHPAMVKGLHAIHSQIEQGTIHIGAAEAAKLQPHQKLYDRVYDGPQAV